MIDNPDTAEWRRRLAVLLDGYDLTRGDDHVAARETVGEAGAETSVRGLRRIAESLGYRGIAPRSRGDVVAAIVTRWALLPAAERAYVGPEDRSPADALRDLLGEAEEALAAGARGVPGGDHLDRFAAVLAIVQDAQRVARDL